jgi:hypothetical protein
MISKIYSACGLGTGLFVAVCNAKGYAHITKKDRWEGNRPYRFLQVVGVKAYIYGFTWPISTLKMMIEVSSGKSIGSVFDNKNIKQDMVIRHFIPCGELMNFGADGTFNHYIKMCCENSPHK